jgi:hypothetical protein
MEFSKLFWVYPDKDTIYKDVTPDLFIKQGDYVIPKLHDLIIKGVFPLEPKELFKNNLKMKFCTLHWKQGRPWEKTGAFTWALNMIKKFKEIDD